jgi:hypothetical protein
VTGRTRYRIRVLSAQALTLYLLLYVGIAAKAIYTHEPLAAVLALTVLVLGLGWLRLLLEDIRRHTRQQEEYHDGP